MKTIRFSKLVEKAGKPEVYLHLTKDDPRFKTALKKNQIMTLLNDDTGSKSGYGLVGYKEEWRGQTLLFPKSLSAYKGARIIGIKFDLFVKQETVQMDTAKKKSSKKITKGSETQTSSKIASQIERRRKPETITKKTISVQNDANTKEQTYIDLRAMIKKAMHALENGNSVAAYNFLKKLMLSNRENLTI